MTTALPLPATSTRTSNVTSTAIHVVADPPVLQPRTARIAALIDPVFLAEVRRI